MKTARSITAILLTVLLIAAFLFAVGAAATDADRTGSIRVTLKTGDGKARPDATLCAYLAAVPDENAELQYSTAPAFKDSGFTVTKTIPDEAAALLSDYAEAHGIAGQSVKTDENGIAAFTDLPQGIYLIRETGETGGYSRMLPFLVFLPRMEGNNRIFDVSAVPKPVSELPPVSILLKADKQIQIALGKNSIPLNARFSFVLTPENVSNPMPKNDDGVHNAETGSLTVSRNGSGAVTFGEIGFSEKDLGKTYTYTVRELKGTDAYFTYDTSVYTVRVSIGRDKDGKMTADVAFTKGSEKVNALVFLNHYSKPDDPPPVPRTGQLWWPVGVLAGCGVLLLLGGFLLRRREEETA